MTNRLKVFSIIPNKFYLPSEVRSIFYLKVRQFVCVWLSVCFLITATRLSGCHEVWNQRSWHKGGAMYMLEIFISLPLKNKN